MLERDRGDTAVTQLGTAPPDSRERQDEPGRAGSGDSTGRWGKRPFPHAGAESAQTGQNFG